MFSNFVGLLLLVNDQMAADCNITFAALNMDINVLFSREIVSTVQTNVGLMREWLRIARQTLSYKVSLDWIHFDRKL